MVGIGLGKFDTSAKTPKICTNSQEFPSHNRRLGGGAECNSGGESIALTDKGEGCRVKFLNFNLLCR